MEEVAEEARILSLYERTTCQRTLVLTIARTLESTEQHTMDGALGKLLIGGLLDAFGIHRNLDEIGALNARTCTLDDVIGNGVRLGTRRDGWAILAGLGGSCRHACFEVLSCALGQLPLSPRFIANRPRDAWSLTLIILENRVLLNLLDYVIAQIAKGYATARFVEFVEHKVGKHAMIVPLVGIGRLVALSS